MAELIGLALTVIVLYAPLLIWRGGSRGEDGEA